MGEHLPRVSRRGFVGCIAAVATAIAVGAAKAAGPAVADNTNTRPIIEMFGDSITYGVGATIYAGYREIIWRSLDAAGLHCAMVGTQKSSATSFPEYPYCEGYPGITADPTTGIGGHIHPSTAATADIITLAVGTNDIGASGLNASDTVANISADLDLIWAMRNSNKLQIGLINILRRLDSYDTTVQAANALLPATIAGKSYAANVTLIDVYASCSVAGDYSDGILHPNDVGCPKVAAAAYPSFAAMVTQARKIF